MSFLDCYRKAIVMLSADFYSLRLMRIFPQNIARNRIKMLVPRKKRVVVVASIGADALKVNMQQAF